MTGASLALMLMAAGFGAPQSRAIVAYSFNESRLDACASSWMGDGLFGVTRGLRRALHREAGTGGCVPAEIQVRFLAREFPLHYPRCAARFAAGALGDFAECWGKGIGR